MPKFKVAFILYRAAKNGVDQGLSAAEKYKVFCEFESLCKKMKHSRCLNCRSVRINQKIASKGPKKGWCEKCRELNYSQSHFIVNNFLPVWKDDNGNIRYDLPECLKNLSHAEKMLIQRISPFVPLTHLKHGVFGLKGHVAAFEQDIGEFMNRLPRRKDDVSVIKVLQSVRAEIGGSRASNRQYKVRKQAVLDSLRFLVKYSDAYKDVEIDPSALDWVKGGESYLPGFDINVGEPANPNLESVRFW